MKKFLLILSALLVLVAIDSYAAKKSETLDFDHTAFDFGTVTQESAPVVHEFSFTNVSSEPVAVLSASAACGCTRPNYPTEPIMPGQTAVIKVTFIPKGQAGEVEKDVKVRFRGAKAKKAERVTLRLTGVVTK